MQRVKWERGSHIYTWWANWVVFKNSHVVYKMRYQFLDIDSGDTLYIFIGFQKRVVAETWHHFSDAFFALFFFGCWKQVTVEMQHRFIDALSTFFSLDIVSMKRQKMPMDVSRWVLLPTNDFPSTIDSIVGELAPRYSGSRICLIFTNFVVLAKEGILVEPKFLISNPISVWTMSSRFQYQLGLLHFWS